MKRPWLTAVLVAALCAATATTAAAANSNARSGNKGSINGTTIQGNTPGFIKKATNTGAADPSKAIDVQVWLKLRSENRLDQLVNQQQTKGSPNYHRWLNQSQFNAAYAPTSQEVNAVTHFLTAHGLTVTSVAENNFYVNVSGPISAVEKAFHVQIDTYTYAGQTYYSNTADPSVKDGSGGLIAAVTGLDDFGAQPTVSWPNGKPQFTPLSSIGPSGLFDPANCFDLSGTATAGGTTASGGSASYQGNEYGPSGPCGYDPGELQTAYNMGGLYSHDLDGTGQTVVIVDAFGSPTIKQDANVFSEVYGLPALDSSNFQVLRAPGVWQNRSPYLGAAGWAGEVTLDVEWVHAMAPGAKIDLVLGPTNTGSLDEAINWAVVHHLGNVISNSWSNFEGLGNPAQFNRDQRILMMAMAEGIDVNFSSGDWGDNSPLFGFKAPSFPSDSPYATSVGGTSLVLDPSNDAIAWQSPWGTDLTRLYDPKTDEWVDPNALSSRLGFQFGGGGGYSLNFAKPSWQSGISGTTRAFPDISLDADPYTGVEIIETVQTDSGPQYGVGVIGGTSLACPLFSGMMAIASQEAGHGLGQVAPLLYGLGSGITDVNQFDGSPNNVTGMFDGNPVTADQLADPLAYPLWTPYLSALYHSPFSDSWFAMDFGEDTSLSGGTGWDDATGLGSPNDATALVNAVAAAAG